MELLASYVYNNIIDGIIAERIIVILLFLPKNEFVVWI